MSQKEIYGKTAYPGFAMAKAKVIDVDDIDVSYHHIEDVKIEIEKLHESIKLVNKNLSFLFERTENLEAKEILSVHLLMLEDPEWIGAIETEIQRGLNVEASVHKIGHQFKTNIEALDDPYLKDRGKDILDLTMQVISNLKTNSNSSLLNSSENIDEHIVIAKDILPSQFLTLYQENMKALVLENLSQTSHSIILAKTYGIPTIVGAKDIVSNAKTGDLIAVNAIKGLVVVHPEPNLKKDFYKKIKEYQYLLKEQNKWASRSSRSLDGIEFEVASNISSLEDAKIAKSKGTEGCGLFRTEFLLMQSKDWPSQSKQLSVYKEIVNLLKPYRSVIRLFDIGGDKSLSYFPMQKEENPFLGLRGYRLLQKNPDLLRDQIKACLLASLDGPVGIMAPMITCLEEVIDFKQNIDLCKQEIELKQPEEKFNFNYQIGIMVEVPAIAFSLRDVVKFIDFISIGTNDLIQYFCATDRMNPEVSYLHDPYNPSTLRFLKFISDQVESSLNSSSLWMGMCGELASLNSYAPLLMALGFKELSVSPGALLQTRKIVCETNVSEAKLLLDKALKSKTSNELKKILEPYNI